MWDQQAIAEGAGPDAVLRNARIPAADGPGLPDGGDGMVRADIHLRAGRIAALTPPRPGPGVDCAGGWVWPAPVDAHVHLDKAHLWTRAPNPDGSFAGAAAAAHAAMQHATPADIVARADFALACAHAHGTVALRSHVDADPAGFAERFAALRELAQAWRGRLTVQLAPFTGPDAPDDWLAALADAAACAESGVLSAYLPDHPRRRAFVDRLFRLADARGLALDFHADESLDPAASAARDVAEAAIAHGFEGPVTLGHLCALSVQPPARCSATLDLIARAGARVVVMPQCNAYLMDRHPGATPRHRGIAPIHEMRARGIAVAIASDNVRDAFHIGGDLDLVEVFRDAVRWAHLDHPPDGWLAAITATPAAILGLEGAGRITPGAPADLVLLPARSVSEFVARPASRRVVLRAGVPIATEPPDLRLLDELEPTP